MVGGLVWIAPNLTAYGPVGLLWSGGNLLILGYLGVRMLRMSRTEWASYHPARASDRRTCLPRGVNSASRGGRTGSCRRRRRRADPPHRARRASTGAPRPKPIATGRETGRGLSRAAARRP
ncbi:hypothetical protein Psi02_04140 [Planotetraspora silvatica]|uniref:Uncharacterized protein n=1 Tax=Planotetraspora silvatica TaxID=234614 RepID=A0A8J3UG08_9ACTN|nr:hypothetical protein [Planotetraspora silvatica]GII43990.1 hypothetical protein Psi02_04140 [Planotetraspora silvatica]